MERRENFKTANLNHEYLKNVVIRFLETSNREPLVPVLAQILHLTDDELTRIKNAAGGGFSLPVRGLWSQ